jgi:hypothetical protein
MFRYVGLTPWIKERLSSIEEGIDAGHRMARVGRHL